MSRRKLDGQSGLGLVCVAGSAGASQAMTEILARLPSNFPAPILFSQHLKPAHVGNLSAILQYQTALRVRWAQHGEPLIAGEAHICPAGSSLTIRPGGTIGISSAESTHERLRSADRFFRSAAETYAHRSVA